MGHGFYLTDMKHKTCVERKKRNKKEAKKERGTRKGMKPREGEGRREKGEGRREKGEGRRKKGEGRREKGEGRREKGEGRKKKGEERGKREGGEVHVTMQVHCCYHSNRGRSNGRSFTSFPVLLVLLQSHLL